MSSTDYRARIDAGLIEWVQLRCPHCSVTVLALAAPVLPAVWCPRPKCGLALLRQVKP